MNVGSTNAAAAAATAAAAGDPGNDAGDGAEAVPGGGGSDLGELWHDGTRGEPEPSPSRPAPVRP